MRGCRLSNIRVEWYNKQFTPHWGCRVAHFNKTILRNVEVGIGYEKNRQGPTKSGTQETSHAVQDSPSQEVISLPGLANSFSSSYPFNPVVVMPRTNVRCAKRNSTTIGKVNNVAAANSRFISLECALTNCSRP